MKPSARMAVLFNPAILAALEQSRDKAPNVFVVQPPTPTPEPFVSFAPLGHPDGSGPRRRRRARTLSARDMPIP